MPPVPCYGSLAQLLPYVVHLMAVGYVVTRHRCVADLEGEPNRGLVLQFYDSACLPGSVTFSQLVCVSVVAWRCFGTITHQSDAWLTCTDSH